MLLQELEPLQRHACFRCAVGQLPQCCIQGTVVRVIIVFVLDFFVFVLVVVNEFIIFSFLPIFVLVFVNENHSAGQAACSSLLRKCKQKIGNQLSVESLLLLWKIWPVKNKLKVVLVGGHFVPCIGREM